jgi:ATP-binding cassette subfamily F protein uup
MPPQARNLVNLENVTVAHGTRLLMDGVSLGVSEGDRIGIVGRNGGGKTTLLKTLIKVEEPHSGRVTHTSGPARRRADPGRPGRRPADRPPGDPRRDGRAHLGRRRAGARGARRPRPARHRLDSGIETMSGGERRAVALASLLVQEWDLLVLDEPTNHLDVEGVAWLAAHLKQRSSSQAHLVVTHDRWFLDEVNRATWEVHDGVVDAYEGGYSAYVLARPSATGWPRPPSRSGCSWSRRSWPGCAAARPRAPASRSSGSTRPTPSSPTSRRPATTSPCSASPPPASARRSTSCTA